MPIDMFDTVTISAISRNVASTSKDAVAGYVDGRFKNFSQLVKQFPLDQHVSIAVSPSDDADALDVEPGDASVAQAPGWVRRQHGRGLARPILYGNLSTLPSLLAVLRAAGIERASVRIWMAHYTFDRNVGLQELTTEDVDGVQYTDKFEGRNLDASVLRDDFFNLRQPPKPKPKRKKLPKPKLPGKPHVKVTAAGISGVLTAAVLAYLNSHGAHVTHLTAPETDAITLASALIMAYLVPSKTP